MTDDRNVFEGISSATLLKPGDRVLIDLLEHTTQQDVDEMVAALKDRFPDVDFTFIAGAHSVFVVPARSEWLGRVSYIPQIEEPE